MMLQVNCHSSSLPTSSASSSNSTPHRRLPSVPEDDRVHFDVLNMTLQSSYHSDPSSMELIKEVVTLEAEVVHLEQYLLSLYRTAFEHRLSTLHSVFTDQGCDLQCKTRSKPQDVTIQSCDKDIDNQGDDRIQPNSPSPACDSAGSDNRSCFPTPTRTPKRDDKNSDLGLRSLADHFGAPLNDHIPESPSRLSEDIISCISSIYCKLAEPPLLPNPSPSLSSTNTFSPQDDHNNWSPQGNAFQMESFKEKNGPYSEMIEVSKICLDDARLNYAATKLQSYRSLIQHLEKVDPRKMKHEAKLAFWINIHNALVMHAYLAYGIHRKRMKSASLISKASYNVGGHSINAHTIQTSILGCRPRCSTSWLQTFLSPRTKIQTASVKHSYSLNNPEPLVHFGLCSGAYSDPAVRLYTVKNVLRELHLSKDEFIQSRVSIYKKTKIILPKILYYFAKDASMNSYALLEMVNAYLSQAQQRVMHSFRKGRPDKYIEWSSYDKVFRYIIHKDLVKVSTSIHH